MNRAPVDRSGEEFEVVVRRNVHANDGTEGV
jgi:hypothetical protein